MLYESLWSQVCSSSVPLSQSPHQPVRARGLGQWSPLCYQGPVSLKTIFPHTRVRGRGFGDDSDTLHLLCILLLLLSFCDIWRNKHTAHYNAESVGALSFFSCNWQSHLGGSEQWRVGVSIDETLLTYRPFTSCCVAQFFTWHGLVPVHGLGIGELCIRGWKTPSL